MLRETLALEELLPAQRTMRRFIARSVDSHAIRSNTFRAAHTKQKALRGRAEAPVAEKCSCLAKAPREWPSGGLVEFHLQEAEKAVKCGPGATTRSRFPLPFALSFHPEEVYAKRLQIAKR
jgi:hypothetical protein